jgi:hypothetical protein
MKCRLPSVAALVVAVSLLAAGCGEPVKVPTSYAKWEPKGEAIFYIDYPEGWNASGGGGKIMQNAEFKKGGCLISVTTDQSSSLIGDITQSANQLGGGGDALSAEEREDLAPAAAAHAWNLKNKPPQDHYGSYKEEKDPIAFQSGFGDSRKSIFTGTVMGRSVKGYRATYIGKDRGVAVFCHCSAGEFEKMRPAFDKVLESVRRGS